MISANTAKENVRKFEADLAREAEERAMVWCENIAHNCIITASKAGKNRVSVSAKSLGELSRKAVETILDRQGYTIEWRMPDLLIMWGE